MAIERPRDGSTRQSRGVIKAGIAFDAESRLAFVGHVQTERGGIRGAGHHTTWLEAVRVLGASDLKDLGIEREMLRIRIL